MMYAIAVIPIRSSSETEVPGLLPILVLCVLGLEFDFFGVLFCLRETEFLLFIEVFIVLIGLFKLQYYNPQKNYERKISLSRNNDVSTVRPDLSGLLGIPSPSQYVITGWKRFGNNDVI